MMRSVPAMTRAVSVVSALFLSFLPLNYNTNPTWLAPSISVISSISMSYSRGILDDALGAVGNTPLIRLSKIAKYKGYKCNLREFR